MRILLRIIVPFCAVSIGAMLPAHAQTAPGGASSAGQSPAASSGAPPTYPGNSVSQGAEPRGSATTGGSGSTAATESLMQRMQQQCGAMTDMKARNACEDHYRQQMRDAAHMGSRPGQFQHNTEQPGKPQ